jgi:hypothetical protein
LDINDYQIEIQYIVQIANGIKCRLKIEVEDNDVNIHANQQNRRASMNLQSKLVHLADPESHLHLQLQQLCIQELKLDDTNSQLTIDIISVTKKSEMRLEQDFQQLQLAQKRTVGSESVISDIHENDDELRTDNFVLGENGQVETQA